MPPPPNQTSKALLNSLMRARKAALTKPTPGIPFLEEAKKVNPKSVDSTLQSLNAAGFLGGRRKTKKQKRSPKARSLKQRLPKARSLKQRLRRRRTSRRLQK